MCSSRDQSRRILNLGIRFSSAPKRDNIYILDASGELHEATLIKAGPQGSGSDDCTCLSPKWESDGIDP